MVNKSKFEIKKSLKHPISIKEIKQIFKKGFNQFFIEKIVYSDYLSSYGIDISNTIIFFSEKKNKLYNELYSRGFKNEFKREGWNFYFKKELALTLEELDSINYLFASNFQPKKDISNSLFLKSFGYRGKITEGFLITTNNSFYIVNSLHESVEDVILNLTLFIKENSLQNISFSRRVIRESLISIDDDLDDNVKLQLKSIEAKLIELKNNGKLVIALPHIENLIAQQCLSTRDSGITLDENYNIKLKEHPSITISLNSMTKVVYALFFKHKKIDISKLDEHRACIIKLYKDISTINDYDKMIKSVDDLINPMSKSIYTHISRIKSAFYSQIHPNIAGRYIIKSEKFGSKTKYIEALIELSDEEKALLTL